MVAVANVAGVIVADDDPMIRNVLRATFEAIGLNVFVTSDGLEAVALAARIRAALIVLDLRMPRLNGLLACQRIRRLPGNAETPIVILTATHDRNAVLAGAKAGATAFHTKPFRTGLLLYDLAQFLPIGDDLRGLISRNAERTSRIAQSAPRRPDYVSPAKPGSDCLLDRDKCVLDALRG